MSQRHSCLKDYAHDLVQYLYQRMVDDQGQRPFALVRLFRTSSYSELDEELQRTASALNSATPLAPDTKCLTLIGTVGDHPDWNDSRLSQKHRAIPLPNVESVERLPMISQLIRQLGLSVGGMLQGDQSALIRDVRTSVFHVPDAVGSPSIPAQAEFVVPYHIRSVVGFGDILPSSQLFAVICFSKAPISQQTAVMFSHLSLSAKLALQAFEETESRVESQIVAVDRLLGNYEEVVCGQERKLNRTLDALRTRGIRPRQPTGRRATSWRI